jgi:hypothetical protein
MGGRRLPPELGYELIEDDVSLLALPSSRVHYMIYLLKLINLIKTKIPDWEVDEESVPMPVEGSETLAVSGGTPDTRDREGTPGGTLRFRV